MHPFARNVVIGVVGLLIAAGLSAIALLNTDSNVSVPAMLASALIATGVGIFGEPDELCPSAVDQGERPVIRRKEGRQGAGDGI